jgi:hypothetical protein
VNYIEALGFYEEKFLRVCYVLYPATWMMTNKIVHRLFGHFAAGKDEDNIPDC